MKPQVNVGIVGEGLTANEFVLTQKDHPKGYYYRGVFTAKDCAPVQEMILRNMTDLSQSVNAEYVFCHCLCVFIGTFIGAFMDVR